jgi:hypothetical protein
VRNKFSIALFTCLFFLINDRISFTQEILQRKVNIHFNSGTHKQYLDSINKQTKIDFVYSDAIRPEETDTINPGEYTLGLFLDKLFQNLNIQYVLRDDAIILSPQKQNVERPEKITVSGKIIARKNQPIPYATVYFARKSIGTLANGEGEFRFLIPPELKSDTLTISCMGYEDKLVPPSEYLNGNFEVRLKSAPIAIKSLTIRHEDPIEIVKKSFQNRFKNCPDKAVLLTAFFREASRQDDEYISLSEALIEVSKSSYLSGAEDLIRLVKGRNGTNTQKSELVNLTVEGGLYNGLRLDVAKYTSYFYSETCDQEYNYRLIKTIFLGERETFVVGFEMKIGLNYAGYRGKLYIDAESYALVRAEFELSPQGISFAKSVLVKKSPRGFSATPAEAKYEVEYRFYNNVWNLYYAKSEIQIKVVKTRGNKDKGFSCNFISTSEFVITGIADKPDERIKARESAGPNDVLVEQVKNTGVSFWNEDNIILPEEPLLKTISKLQDDGIIKPEPPELGKE